MELQRVQGLFESILEQVGRVVVGQQELVEGVVLALFAEGSVLIEGPPGLGKTLLVNVLSKTVSCQFRRVQFTPDLMPSDLTGHSIYDMRKQEFSFNPGPVFTNLLLTDEINRSPPKTQSALLEVMQEQQVSVDGTTHMLQRPFLVIATQNPIEHEGTYPLPEAQVDRFMFKLLWWITRRRRTRCRSWGIMRLVGILGDWPISTCRQYCGRKRCWRSSRL